MAYVRRLGAAGAICASLAMAGSAQAETTSVTATIKAQDNLIKNNATYKGLQNFHANGKAQAQALLIKLTTLDGMLRHAATAVSGASATGSQERGQKEWVTGDRDQVAGIAELKTGVKDPLARKDSAVKPAFTKGVDMIKKGDLTEMRADKLLGLPAKD